jgi:natural product biosynthesis luciferase-like monooxygenase protein
MGRLAAAFVGSDTLLLQCIDAWIERGHEVVAVATDAEKVRRFCQERGLRCLPAGAQLAAALEPHAFDHLFLVTWLELVSEHVLARPRVSTINLHDGPLPRYAGLNAPCWAILHGERQHAVTWHVVEPKADTGAILVQRTFAITDDDTAFTLNARCFEAAQESFGALADGLAAGTLTPAPQDLAQRTFFGRAARPRAFAVLDWQQPAAEVARVVRALDHGGYRNPLAIAKVRAPKGWFVPGRVEVGAGRGAAPGTVTELGGDRIVIACAGSELVIHQPRCLRGSPLDEAALGRLGVLRGVALPLAAAEEQEQWTTFARRSGADEPEWVEILRTATPLPLPDGRPAGAVAKPAQCPVAGVASASGDPAAAWFAFLSRRSGVRAVTIGRRDEPVAAAGALATLAAAWPPVTAVFAGERDVATALRAAREELDRAAARGPLVRDVVVRRSDVLPAGVVLEPPVRLAVGGSAPHVDPGSLVLWLPQDGAPTLCFDEAALDPARAQQLAAQFAVFCRALAADPARPLAKVPVLDEAELTQQLRTWNGTLAPAPVQPCVHRQFEAQAAATPQRVALHCRGEDKTYEALAADVERLAGWLRGRGVAPGDRVGICTRRGFGMVTAVLAALRCGAAYVPLDPTYPRERLQFMADDAELAALVVDRTSAAIAPTVACARIDLDGDASAINAADPLLDVDADGDRLAYVIYTSGSTGRPKGVMVRHRNVTNFFAGMDRVLGTEPGVWLAVTSLSFDISVLELLWTLCRGFRVVVHTGEAKAPAVASPHAARPVGFSMFYFASDEGERAADKYRLLLDGARFADEHGFEAVWTPERHFHAFGGLYPNPAVAGAAIAAITKNVAIRAGSCVVTLHHPIRVAEEWSLVDNLSRGRVGIAFAAGWHARDFVLRPESFAERKTLMFENVRQVQALWRGEEVAFPGHDGKPVAVRTLPRPVQPSLPTWVTVAGNPETYRMAGESGSNVLTHLLGQSLEELTQKLAVYRQAWRDAGHAGEGRVTLMLHTFVGDDEQRVRAIVREPMKGYLRSSLDLVKQAAWSFPAFKQRVDKPGEMDALLNGGLTPEDFEALLEFSFERYYRQSGLFGTPEQCVAIVDRLRGMQIDEIACLVDFGVPTDEVLAMLPKLAEVKRRCDAVTAAARAGTGGEVAEPTIPELMQAHAVTHFQCTPSMAGMLLVDPAAAGSFRGLRQMLVGGEALPTALARELRRLVPKVHDVYGPTETTVWSTTGLVGDDDPVPIGRPLANQTVYVLDADLEPVPIGSAGELWIGGAGVTAGYFRRPELTAERFRPDPFAPGGTMYGTGDLVRWRSDGVLEYLGRKDLQVKVRGYRIELGEIEAALGQLPGVREGAVVARTDGGDTRLVAYYVARQPAPGADDLRAQLRKRLPEFMVPSVFVALADLPRTPNLKIDRKALPAPEAVGEAAKRPVVAAEDDTEDSILGIWRQALGTDDVGVEDNFFDSGGHSILAVRVHREIQQKLGVDLQVTDLFRFTTVRALARHLRAGKAAPTAAQQAAERARQRRNALRRG